MAVALRYFTAFGKPAFQHITASARIKLIKSRLFNALHEMQTRYSDENSVRLSVCPSVRLSVRLSVRHTRDP